MTAKTQQGDHELSSTQEITSEQTKQTEQSGFEAATQQQAGHGTHKPKRPTLDDLMSRFG